MQADSDLQEYADRWQDDREKNAYDVQGRLVIDLAFRIETRTGADSDFDAKKEQVAEPKIARMM